MRGVGAHSLLDWVIRIFAVVFIFLNGQMLGVGAFSWVNVAGLVGVLALWVLFERFRDEWLYWRARADELELWMRTSWEVVQRAGKESDAG